MWKCDRCGRQFKNINQHHFCGKINTVDDYIADQPTEIQPILQSIRMTIAKAAPQAVEKISWQMPTFWQGENIIHFAAFKDHIGIFPGGEAVGVFQERLTGYQTSKGTIHFPLNKPIDYQLITDIVHWRLGQAKSSVSTYTEPVKRKRYSMPDDVAEALRTSGLTEQYNARPPYQRNDYIGWITAAKQEITRQKRLSQMLDELRAGDVYMKMHYKIKE